MRTYRAPLAGAGQRKKVVTTKREVAMNNRVQAFQARLAEKQTDCAVIGPTTNMRYLLGGAPHADERLCLFLVTPDSVQMIVPELNAAIISSFTDIEMLTWADARGPDAALSRSILSNGKIRVLAIDGSMRADFLLAVLEQCDQPQTTPVDPIVAKLRAIKSPLEIEALAKAASQADRAMQAAVDACRPGATENEIAWATEKAFRKDGAERVEFTLVASGQNAAIPHHHSSDKVLQKGEGIIIDIGASLNGYKSDITRNVFLGDPDKEYLDTYELVRSANTRGRETVRPGILAEEVDRATRVVIEEKGMGNNFIHRTGHGLGMDIHEEPWIQEGNTTPLEAGMVFSVEPGVYVPGRMGIRVEDIVAVTTEGMTTLTGFEHSLVIK
jgi:Xaa-Pro aminopeptidase